ncbi:MAG: DoxX family membrane protein [Flavobacteriales bacterium]|nr:DoxX family membrane protein [Flavobacteriales bacterium]
MMMTLNQQIAVLTTRLLLGFIFLMQGFGKVFTYGIEQVYEGFFKETYQDLLPELVIYSTAYYTSYIELIGGILLILGFCRDYALYALASVLVIITFGHGLVEPIWDLSHMMYRAILLITLLILPKEWDKFSVDSLLEKNK